MANIEIEAPDGSIVEFPEGTPDATIEKAMQQTYGRKTTGLGAAAAGVGQGLLFGFGDEAAAGTGALYDYFTGKGDFSKSYDKRVKQQRDYLKSAAKENPGWYYSGMIGGAVGVPFTAPGRLATAGAGRLATALRAPSSGLGRAASVGAIEGAGYGALSGAGMSQGDLQSRAEGAVGGGLLGGATGAAAPVVIQGITSGIREGVNRARDIATPRAAATRDVARAMQEADAAAPAIGPNGRNMDAEAEAIIARGLADDVRLRVDAGERTRALARRAANLSPEARATLNRSIDPRFNAQSERGRAFLRRQNPAITGDNQAVRSSLREQARNANRPAYERAFAEGDRPINSPEIERLMSSPMVREAMQKAVPRMKNRAVTEGYQGFNARVQVTDDGQVIFNRGPEGVPTFPNLAFWDTVKRELDDVANRSLRETGSRGEAGQLARALRGELDNVVPSYQGTRSQAMRFFQAEDALEAGENFARGGIRADAREMARAVNSMTTQELRVFRESYANSLLRRIENIGDRQAISKRFAQSSQARQELIVGLGRQRAQEFEAWLHLESIADRAREALQGNSTTARQLMEMGGAGIASGTIFGGGDPTTPEFWRNFFMGAGGAWGARRLNATVAERWANKVADLLTKRDNPQELQKALRTLARNDRFVDGLRRYMSSAATPAAGLAAGSVGAQDEPLRGDVERNAAQ